MVESRLVFVKHNPGALRGEAKTMNRGRIQSRLLKKVFRHRPSWRPRYLRTRKKARKESKEEGNPSCSTAEVQD